MTKNDFTKNEGHGEAMMAEKSDTAHGQTPTTA
jgi:hypothetical protein